jgi:hypothetical protein
LQHLFLSTINNDALDWAGAWNNHTIGIYFGNQRSRTPRDMFFFGMIEEGPRGLVLADEDIADEDIAGYGVDWEALEDRQIRGHHDEANTPETGLEVGDDMADNPFERHVPEHLAVVEVEEPNCPLSVEQVNFLDNQLDHHGLWGSRSVESYRLRWITALQICRNMYIL